MKPHTLPVKRRPIPKGIFRRLSAVTRSRKQRVAAAATAPTAEIETEDGGSKISRALTIIFLIHIVAIGLIFFHQRFLDGRPAETSATTKTEPAASTPAAQTNREDRPRLAAGEKPYFVKSGDNYARIAAAEGVDEGELRLVNKHVEICSGLLLRIPPKRIVAVEPPELTAIREQTPSDRDRGLVEAVDVSHAPKAQLIHPNVKIEQSPKSSGNSSAKTSSTPSSTKHTTLSASPKTGGATSPKTTTGSGKSYVVQSGDSIWRIASKYKTSQDSIMRANGITDARKVKPGMKIVIP